MEVAMNVCIGLAICGLMGWMMSSGARYRSRPAEGLGKGLLFGLAMLLPFLAMVPLLFASETALWVANLWLVTTIVYQASLGMLFVKHRASKATAKVPVKESLKVNYGSIGLSDITPAA